MNSKQRVMQKILDDLYLAHHELSADEFHSAIEEAIKLNPSLAVTLVEAASEIPLDTFWQAYDLNLGEQSHDT